MNVNLDTPDSAQTGGLLQNPNPTGSNPNYPMFTEPQQSDPQPGSNPNYPTLADAENPDTSGPQPSNQFPTFAIQDNPLTFSVNKYPNQDRAMPSDPPLEPGVKTPNSLSTSDLPVDWPANPVIVTCPFCASKDYTNVKKELGSGAMCGIIICLVLCL
jgi:hypothetical protein